MFLKAALQPADIRTYFYDDGTVYSFSFLITPCYSELVIHSSHLSLLCSSKYVYNGCKIMLYKVVFSTADYILMFFVRKLSGFPNFIFYFIRRGKKRDLEKERRSPRSLDRAFLLSCISGDVRSTFVLQI
jgi:hypothetical protein